MVSSTAIPARFKIVSTQIPLKNIPAQTSSKKDASEIDKVGANHQEIGRGRYPKEPQQFRTATQIPALLCWLVFLDWPHIDERKCRKPNDTQGIPPKSTFCSDYPGGAYQIGSWQQHQNIGCSSRIPHRNISFSFGSMKFISSIST